MTAERAPSQRVVVLKRAEHNWPDGYFGALLGLDVRMPAVVERGRVLAGFLVAVEESATEFVLTFEGLQPED